MFKRDLKWRMIVILLVCWLVPIALVSFVVFFSVNKRMTTQISRTVATSANKTASLIELQLSECINASRNATYYSEIEQNYKEYKETGDHHNLYEAMNLYLSTQYRFNKNISSTMVFFIEDPNLFYYTYTIGNTYDRVLWFKSNLLNKAISISDELSTDVYFLGEPGHIFLLRNLVDSSFKPYGMIVMELNCASLFEALSSVWGYESSGVYIDGELCFNVGGNMPESIEVSSSGRFSTISKINKHYYVCYSDKIGKNTVSYYTLLDNQTLFAGVNATYIIFAATLIILIPLVISVFAFLKRMVSRPVEKLVEASREISEGQYGYHIEDSDPGSNEFRYLNESFNNMSDKLKHQFETIYVEELAIRDANIKALQSQINPHFLNNTLEIINWEARLNGVYKVSNMIEALSTMLNSTLNRKNVQLIPLSEELQYVDAYLYIISERMGSRLKTERNIDESLLSSLVPGLIIQPIIENAIEHGIKKSGENIISINIYSKGEYIFIDVRNTGNISEDDAQKVKSLLSSEEPQNMHSVSIGIRNVNRRLKLMYGDECGLTVDNDGENTLSRIIYKKGAISNEI